MEATNQRSKALLGSEYYIPEWAKHIIWYQIFPERFRNGDPTNNPTADRINAPQDWQLSAWTSDWYHRAKWEKAEGINFLDTVYYRRYGGDLQGIIDKLDYLQNLGVGAIYLNPVFDAISLHKYDTSYYHHIDRFFGPDPQGDLQLIEQEDPQDPSTWQWTSADRLFLQLIQEVHSRGMKIIIDGVFNHTGTDFWAFRDIRKKQESSPYKDWYNIKTFDNGDLADSVFEYKGWWGFKSLPEWKEVAGTLAKPVREHIFAITQRWMAPNGKVEDGIDGWRLDVPEEVGKKFWIEWNALVRSINPEAYTVGEIWSSASNEWVSGDLFTAAMNYPFAETVQNYMIDQNITASTLLARLREQRSSLPNDAPLGMQNLMDSHDTPRLASMVVNPGREYNEQAKPEDGFTIRKPNNKERRIQKLIALFQYTYVGTPMVYYGTEAGMWGATDPDNRKPMVWPEYRYQQESRHPLKGERPADDNNFDHKLFKWYQKLGRIRNNYQALQTGNFLQLLCDDEKNIFTFARTEKGAKPVIVAINRSTESQYFNITITDLEISETANFRNLLTDTRVEVKDKELTLILAPISGAILTLEEK